MGRHRAPRAHHRRPLTGTAAAAMAVGLCLGAPGVAAAQTQPLQTPPLQTPPLQTPPLPIPVPQQTEDTGKIRIGHLSPTTPAVDMYLSRPGAVEVQVARGTGYSAVTPYLERSPGLYTIAARRAGAPADSPPVVTATVEVSPGSAQTAFFFDTGVGGTVQGQVLLDEETPVAPGSGLVRIVQGAGGAGPVDAQAVGGPPLADDLRYGTSTAYAPVPARPWSVEFSAGGFVHAATLEVESGSVTTVVVTRDVAGRLTVTPLQDVDGVPLPAVAPLTPALPEVQEQPVPPAPGTAAGDAAAPEGSAAPGSTPMPRGGVPAGGGWGAGPDSGPLPVAAALLLAVGIVAGGSRLRARRDEHG